MTPDTDNTIDHILGSDGPIARALGGHYEPRDEQIDMARRVAETLDDRSHLLVEAGTGVGKSFAYLVPAILRCIELGEKVVVATNTIALQEQLIEKDIPLLAGILGEGGDAGGNGVPRGGEEDEVHGRDARATRGGEKEDRDTPSDPLRVPPPPPGAREGKPTLRPVLVKGRGNYLSIRRLKLTSARADRLLPDAASRRSLKVIEEWAYDTEDGTLSTLPPVDRMGVWDKVRSDSGNCMGRRCPHHAECFYQSARREMESANLLICNHALFFSDLALRARDAGFLPSYDHVILDEAHGVEDAAADHFGLSLTEGRVMHLLTTLHHPRTGRGYLPHLELASGDIGPIGRAVELVTRAEQASRVFFEDLVRLSRSPEVTNGRIRRAGAIPNALSEAMNELAVRLRRLKDDVRTDADRFELQAYALRAGEIADSAEALVEQTVSGCCYWIEAGQGHTQVRGRSVLRVKLACAPVDVGPLLHKHLFEQDHSVVLTSATLATRTIDPDEQPERAETAFGHIMGRLGCDGARTLQLGSPFDYGRQVELVVDTTMPNPGNSGRRRGSHGRDARATRGDVEGREPESFENALARRVHDQVVATEGGAFVLFTSFRTLYQMADRLGPAFEALGYPLFVQGRGGSRTQLLEQFRVAEDGVLFGAASFWQGVDVRGRALRNVIITRLPFEPPDRPLTQARLEQIEERGGNPFRDDSLPRAVIRFKQGFGRLIRSSTDRGRVVVLDPRIATKSYGRLFLRSLPVGIEPEVIRAEQAWE